MSRKQKRWSYSEGNRPHTVIVEERMPGGIIYGRVWNPKTKNWVRKSLKHRDKDRAKTWALKQAAKLKEGDEAIRAGKVTLAMVFAAYRKHRTPRKSLGSRKTDERRSEMWTRVLGASKDPHLVSDHEWDSFVDERRSGAIDARGRQVPAQSRRPVRNRAVEVDCNWLKAVFNWATTHRPPTSRQYLMRENPIRGYASPREENIRHPVATHDRYEAVRAVSDDVLVQDGWGTGLKRRSHLSELLDIVNGTGRRISAVCKLRYEDLRLEDGPHGAIRWPASTDKIGRETVVPVSPEVRGALDRIMRERPGIGTAPLFPSPGDDQKPITRHLADKWLRKAEELAGLESQRGSLWHAYRRKWVTERKHHPDVDVAAAGGWKSVETLKVAYQRPDPGTMLRVVLEPGQLREAL